MEALRELCNYVTTEATEPSDLEQSPEPESTEVSNAKPTLHEILIQEKLDFEAKVQRAAKRKRWLRANETLLRTLLSYCSLHGATGGLASVRMELVLLLQELQQEKTNQQLLSPLPFPTSLPLLAASVASCKTVVADPIRYLQCLTQDMLQTVRVNTLYLCTLNLTVMIVVDGGAVTAQHVTKPVNSPEGPGSCSVRLHLSITM